LGSRGMALRDAIRELANALAFWFATAFIALALALMLTVGKIVEEMVREAY